MSITNLNLLPALGTLTRKASRINKFHSSLRFRFRRCAVDAIPALAELTDAGATFKVYTGGLVLTCKDGQWTTRRTPKVRPWLTVEVNCAA